MKTDALTMALEASFSCDQFKSCLDSAVWAVRTEVRVLPQEHHEKMKAYRPTHRQGLQTEGIWNPNHFSKTASYSLFYSVLTWTPFHFLLSPPLSFKHFQSDFHARLCIDLSKSEFSNNIPLRHLYQPPPQFSFPYFFKVPLAFQTTIHIFLNMPF